MKPNPAVIYIESVHGCPYSCAMCKCRRTKPQKMSHDLLAKLEPYFKDLEVMSIHGNGEPLLGDLNYFVEQSVKHNFAIHMNTTGFFLTEKIINQLLQTRLSIRFSIHSGKSETYKRVMGYDFARARKNISDLVKKAENSIKSHDFWFSFIVMKENVDEIEDFLHLTHDCGVKKVRFMRLMPNKLSLKGVKMQDRDFKFNYFKQFNKEVINNFQSKLPAYQNLADQLGVRIEFGSMLSYDVKRNKFKEISNKATEALFSKKFFPLERIKGACIAPWIGQLQINLQGNVNLCCETNCYLGNLNDSSLAEIWNSDKMQHIRKSFKEGYIPKVCGYCRGFGFDNYPENAFVGIDKFATK